MSSPNDRLDPVTTVARILIAGYGRFADECVLLFGDGRMIRNLSPARADALIAREKLAVVSAYRAQELAAQYRPAAAAQYDEATLYTPSRSGRDSEDVAAAKEVARKLAALRRELPKASAAWIANVARTWPARTAAALMGAILAARGDVGRIRPAFVGRVDFVGAARRALEESNGDGSRIGRAVNVAQLRAAIRLIVLLELQ
jgi:hypothetical protein